jgi:hypothetical protein
MMSRLLRTTLFIPPLILIQEAGARENMATGIVFNDITHNFKPDAGESVQYNL